MAGDSQGGEQHVTQSLIQAQRQDGASIAERKACPCRRSKQGQPDESLTSGSSGKNAKMPAYWQITTLEFEATSVGGRRLTCTRPKLAINRDAFSIRKRSPCCPLASLKPESASVRLEGNTRHAASKSARAIALKEDFSGRIKPEAPFLLPGERQCEFEEAIGAG